MVNLVCEQCGTTFRRIQRQPLCSRECRAAWNARRPTADRFWAKVQKGEGCWIWTGGKGHGYGRFFSEDVVVLAHRFSWELHFGAVPSGLLVCHHCDNRSCVRPDHLFLGTFADNTHDMLDKGRGSAPPVRIGEAVNTARLSPEQVLALRASNRPAREIAAELGVSKSAVVRARSRRTWSHL